MKIQKTVAALSLSWCTALGANEIPWNDASAVARMAAETHPSVARAAADVSAARERAASAGALPHPMAMAGVRDLQVDLSRDEMMTMYMVGASQTFTRGSKRRIQTTAAELEVTRAAAELESTRVEIERDARFRYYDVAALDSQIHATESVAKLAEALLDAARVRYETGSTIQADVIRAQLVRTNLTHELLQLRTRRKVAAAQLAEILGIEAEAIPRLTVRHDVMATGQPSSDRLNESTPALAALEAERDLEQSGIELAKAATKPDIDVEASYGVRPALADMISVVARVQIPIRRERIEPRIREAVARRESANQRVEERRRALKSAFAVADAFHEEAEAQARLHEEVLVPQSRLAFESAIAAYQAGKGSFELLLDALNSYLRLETDYYSFLAQHLKSAADLEALARGARFGASTGARAVVGTKPMSPAESNTMSSM